jgi:hypothetical protein
MDGVGDEGYASIKANGRTTTGSQLIKRSKSKEVGSLR